MTGDRSGWVAGLNHGAHDAACALFKDGRLVVAVEQERISRRKKAVDEGPGAALAACLSTAGIGLGDLDGVALGSDHDRLADWLGVPADARWQELPYDHPDHLFPAELFDPRDRPRLVPIRHHLAHAGSSFWPSGSRHAAILVMDAMGEDDSTSLAVGDVGGITIRRAYPVSASLGFFYEAACIYAGLGRDSAGKLMGLAPYGRPTENVGLAFRDGAIRWAASARSDLRGRAMIDGQIDAMVDWFRANCYPYAVGCVQDIMAYANFAASVQAALDSIVVDLARELRTFTDAPDLVVAGGVGLNCTANGVLSRAGLFDRVWVQPMAHDAGTAIGSALVAVGQLGGEVPADWSMGHAYYGFEADDEEIRMALKDAGLRSEELNSEQVGRRAAELLAAGKMLAWHQGRAEVGPRALGARSFLGDPRQRETLVRLNTIKRREMWRPLAPSVLEEYFHDWFVGAPNPFMIVAATVRPEQRPRIPAVVHVDGSARPQVVRAATNPRYAELIAAFRDLTGVPVVVNTSLNLDDEPVCLSAADTVRTFQRSGADALVIGRHLVLHTNGEGS